LAHPQNLLRFLIIQKGVKSEFWILGFSEEFQIETCCYLIGEYLVITPSSKGIIESSITCLTKCHSWLTNLTFENILIILQI
jgi:hypothetical protein